MPGFPKVLPGRRGGVPRSARARSTRRPQELAGRHRPRDRPRARGAAAADDPAPTRSPARARKLVARFDDEQRRLRHRARSSRTRCASTCSSRGALEGDARSPARPARPRRDARGRHLRPARRRLSPLLDRRAVARAALREDALRQRAPPPPLRRRLARDSASRATRETARAIAAYVAREMTAPRGRLLRDAGRRQRGRGGEVLRLDARRGRRGRAATTTRRDARVRRAFGITAPGQLRGERRDRALRAPDASPIVAAKLGRRTEPIECALASRARAGDVRGAREAAASPFRDEKVLASWNGLMIGALADAGGRARRRRHARRRGARARLRRARPRRARGRRRACSATRRTASAKGPGFLDDHAFVARRRARSLRGDGRAALGRARARARRRDRSRTSGTTAEGGFFFAPDDGEAILVRAKDPFDHAVPSGASIACRLLLRLGALVDAKYAEPRDARRSRGSRPRPLENPFGMGRRSRPSTGSSAGRSTSSSSDRAERRPTTRSPARRSARVPARSRPRLASTRRTRAPARRAAPSREGKTAQAESPSPTSAAAARARCRSGSLRSSRGARLCEERDRLRPRGLVSDDRRRGAGPGRRGRRGGRRVERADGQRPATTHVARRGASGRLGGCARAARSSASSTSSAGAMSSVRAKRPACPAARRGRIATMRRTPSAMRRGMAIALDDRLEELARRADLVALAGARLVERLAGGAAVQRTMSSSGAPARARHRVDRVHLAAEALAAALASPRRRRGTPRARAGGRPSRPISQRSHIERCAAPPRSRRRISSKTRGRAAFARSSRRRDHRVVDVGRDAEVEARRELDGAQDADRVLAEADDRVADGVDRAAPRRPPCRRTSRGPGARSRS